MTIWVQACICLRFFQIWVSIIAKLVGSSRRTSNSASHLLVNPHWPKIETTRISEHIQVQHWIHVVANCLLVFERLYPCTRQQRRSEKPLVWFDSGHRRPLIALKETTFSFVVLIVKICARVLVVPFAERFSSSLRCCKERRLANRDQVWLKLVLVVCIVALRGLIVFDTLLLTFIKPELILLTILLRNPLLILVDCCIWIICSIGVKLCILRIVVLRLIVRLLGSSNLMLLLT